MQLLATSSWLLAFRRQAWARNLEFAFWLGACGRWRVCAGTLQRTPSIPMQSPSGRLWRLNNGTSVPISRNRTNRETVKLQFSSCAFPQGMSVNRTRERPPHNLPTDQAGPVEDPTVRTPKRWTGELGY